MIVLATGLVALWTAAAVASATTREAELVALPETHLAKCTASRLLRPACTPLVPRVNGRYRAFFATDGRLEPRTHIFNLEFFVASEPPPKGAHVAVAAGAVWRLTPYLDPSARTRAVPLSTPVDVNRTRPVSYGVRTWNGRRGVLYLAPPYIYGGMLGDHLVFQWQHGRRTYVVSLHTWWPLAETLASLKAMVMALD